MQCPETQEEEMAILRRHVENDIPAAIRRLGSKYEFGLLSLVPSPKKATRLYRRAADLGDMEAMYMVGISYLKGNGVKYDKKKAVKYFRMAADRGYVLAQYNLGGALRKGDGVTQDDDEALRFYKLAAEQGLTEAEFNLGLLYVYGQGVARDTAEATRWLERAAAKGYEPAMTMRARLRSDLSTAT